MALDEYFRQEALRSPGQSTAKLPKTSRLLDELMVSNKLNLQDVTIRQRLIAFLTDVAEHAPVVHLSFATDPSSAFLNKIVQWLRQNIHTSILVQVGLQPSIGAGCILRTTNKYFDLSLHQRLIHFSAELIKDLNKTDVTAQAVKQ
jgi:F0F1-type ATP synthase delta subunit